MSDRTSANAKIIRNHPLAESDLFSVLQKSRSELIFFCFFTNGGLAK
jgi:hypothetical protein